MQFEEFITTYNELIKSYNRMYHRFAFASGLSDAAWTVLYELRMNGKTISQKDLGELISMSKQTINSAVKSLVNKRLIELQYDDSDKRIRSVVLTEQGKKFCKEHIDKILKAEERAFCKLTSDDAELFMSIEKKYFQLLLQETEGNDKNE